MIKQSNPWGCGVYAVANALNLPSFVTEERIAKSKDYGNSYGQLSKWLQDDGYSYFLDALYFDLEGSKLPDNVCSYKPIGKTVIMLPALFNVRYSDSGLNHLVAGQITPDGEMFLLDSLRDEAKAIKVSDMNDLYHVVYGMYIFLGLETCDYVMFHKNELHDPETI